MAVDYGPSDELAGVASRTWGTSCYVPVTRVAIDKDDDMMPPHYMYSFDPHPSGDAGVRMRVMPVRCVSQPHHTYAYLYHVALFLTSLSQYCHHGGVTTSSGFSERPSATLPNFHQR